MATGTTVRIRVGKLNGRLGEIIKVERGVYTVRHSCGVDTFRARDLEAVA